MIATDNLLVQRAASADLRAFDVLVRRYQLPVFRLCLGMLGDEDDAQDAAQDTFFMAWRAIGRFRGDAKFSTWLYRIATNLGVNQARDTRHERAASTVYLDEADSETGTTPDVADSTPDVEAKLLRDERMAAIRDHVMALPERQKMAVLMHKYEGMDYSQIGEVLKLSESATKSLLFRAYQTLREKLKGFV